MLKKLLSSMVLVASISSSAFAMGHKAPGLAESNVVINDSLVKDLQCSTLSKDTVLSSIQSDAFDRNRELPLQGWNSPDGMGHCWALSHAQRIFFYLARFSGNGVDELTAQPSTTNPADILDMVRGSNDFKIFSLTSPSSLDTVIDSLNSVSGRSFTGDLDHYQVHRFASPGNLPMILHNHARPASENEDTFAAIQADLSKNRLPIIVIRADRLVQHVVLVKKAVGPDEQGNYKLTVYDSNLPGTGNHLTYSTTTQEFYAQNVMEGMADDASVPMGVFLVDDDDMDDIQNALLTYYTNRCLQAPTAQPSPTPLQ